MINLIDRQAAINALKRQAEAMNEWSIRYAEQRKGILTALNIVEDLPSAQPERIKARWILAENQRPDDMENDNYLFICSNCGSTDLHSKRVPVPYCWNCGAEMLREMTEWTN